MNVQEAMDAYRDGTFEKRVIAERREAAKHKPQGGVQKGRDLYESMYPTKKEQ